MSTDGDFPVLKIRANSPIDVAELTLDGKPIYPVSIDLRMHADEITTATLVLEVVPDIEAPIEPLFLTWPAPIKAGDKVTVDNIDQLTPGAVIADWQGVAAQLFSTVPGLPGGPWWCRTDRDRQLCWDSEWVAKYWGATVLRPGPPA